MVKIKTRLGKPWSVDKKPPRYSHIFSASFFLQFQKVTESGFLRDKFFTRQKYIIKSFSTVDWKRAAWHVCPLNSVFQFFFRKHIISVSDFGKKKFSFFFLIFFSFFFLIFFPAMKAHKKLRSFSKSTNNIAAFATLGGEQHVLVAGNYTSTHTVLNNNNHDKCKDYCNYEDSSMADAQFRSTLFLAFLSFFFFRLNVKYRGETFFFIIYSTAALNGAV